jgi:hypothetical protein
VPVPKTVADPYGVLGLEPGAPLAEVKRAYRRLAKSFHPDSAGEQAAPRFIAIQAAYEQIRTGRSGTAGTRATSAAGAAPAAGAEPWRADPARARAARERARAGRSGAGQSGGAATSPGTSSSGPRTGSANGPGSAGTTGSAGGRSSTGTGGATRRRGTRKATMGSTSYDEARDHVDATWSGASWYGPSTGEYWIVNPREYADPRKHGPGYQSRARRTQDPDATPPSVAGADDPDGGDARGRSQPDARDGGPSVTSSPPRARETPTAASRGPRRANAAWSSVGSAGAAASAGEQRAPDRTSPPGAGSLRWLGAPSDDPVRRFGLALVAWPPIGLVTAMLIGNATGCTTFGAACDGVEPMLPWLAQALILGLLLLLPPVTRILAAGSVALLAGLVPLTMVLLAVGGATAPQAGGALISLLGGLWLVGVGWAFVARVRRAAGGRGHDTGGGS